MKKTAAYIASLILTASLFTSCEMLGDNCQICHQVTYDNGNPVNYGDETELCGDELFAVKANPETTYGNITIRWVCY
ncbi:MAG: hypothetical protein P1P83_09015 [Bacteroidales bacterium]|nr:hypothetical protein [Bacteroidales bacterium]MDT8373620.1 hypothetical protein [Bacteroidales bacterium]